MRFATYSGSSVHLNTAADDDVAGVVWGDLASSTGY